MKERGLPVEVFFFELTLTRIMTMFVETIGRL